MTYAIHQEEPLAYLAGPMTGLRDYNFPLFAQVAAQLRARNIAVLSPHECGADPTDSYEDCLRKAIYLLLNCRQLILLPGWEKSKGATVELQLARALNYRVRFWVDGELVEKDPAL